MDFDIKNPDLAPGGRHRIDWAEQEMAVLRGIKEQFANDPINLLIVDDGLNSQKGAKSITEWLPPRQEAKCLYVARWAKVAYKYDLEVTSEELLIIDEMKGKCHESMY